MAHLPFSRTSADPPAVTPCGILPIVLLVLTAETCAQTLFPVGERRPLAASATAILTDDLDSDGWPDLALTHQSTGSVSVRLSRPDTLFAEPRRYKVGLGPLSIEAGDLNGDGAVDLVVANSGSSTISVLINRGDGRYEPSREFAVGIRPKVSAPRRISTATARSTP